MARKRALTFGEIALAREAFGDRVDFRRVIIVDGPAINLAASIAFRRGNPAITVGSTIFFKHGVAADFAAATGTGRNAFMHEMTHVWQFQKLGMARFLLRYARELARAGGRPNRMYGYRPGGTKFDGAMLEAQAQMVGDYAEALTAQPSQRVALLARSLAGSGIYGL